MPTYPKWRLLMSVNLMLSKHIQTEQKNTRELVNIIWKLQSVSITYHFTLASVAPCDGVSFVWWIKRNTDIPRARLELAPCALRRLACSLNSRLCDWLTDDDQEGVLDGLMEALRLAPPSVILPDQLGKRQEGEKVCWDFIILVTRQILLFCQMASTIEREDREVRLST